MTTIDELERIIKAVWDRGQRDRRYMVVPVPMRQAANVCSREWLFTTFGIKGK
jgi:hypothetical protein